jgi:hypothetical protein
MRFDPPDFYLRTVAGGRAFAADKITAIPGILSTSLP